jgi:hypothetical protein
MYRRWPRPGGPRQNEAHQQSEFPLTRTDRALTVVWWIRCNYARMSVRAEVLSNRIQSAKRSGKDDGRCDRRDGTYPALIF